MFKFCLNLLKVTSKFFLVENFFDIFPKFLCDFPKIFHSNFKFLKFLKATRRKINGELKSLTSELSVILLILSQILTPIAIYDSFLSNYSVLFIPPAPL